MQGTRLWRRNIAFLVKESYGAQSNAVPHRKGVSTIYPMVVQRVRQDLSHRWKLSTGHDSSRPYCSTQRLVSSVSVTRAACSAARNVQFLIFKKSHLQPPVIGAPCVQACWCIDPSRPQNPDYIKALHFKVHALQAATYAQ